MVAGCLVIAQIPACHPPVRQVATGPRAEKSETDSAIAWHGWSTEELRRRTRRYIQSRTGQHFEKALFFKPSPGDLGGMPHDLAPLIVQRFRPPADTASPGSRSHRSTIRFGSWSTEAFTETGMPRFDPDRPGVYWRESSLEIITGADDGVARTYRQFSYVWWYPSRDPDAPPVPEGFRMTLDEHGFPIVWEVRSTAGEMEIVYVAESIEAAALDAFGPPLPERKYAVEPPVEEAPDLVVARVLADGPVPMGPFVYLGACPRSIATLLCRCMPSQADEFVETAYYELSPLDRLVELGFTPTDRFPFVRFDETDPPSSADDVDTEGTEEMAGGSPLERLRWPG